MLVNTHGHVNRFRAVLVAYKDAVLSRIFHVDIVYSDAAALGRLSDYKVILAEYLPIVTKPEDLWGWFAINVARQTQRLKRRSKQDMKWQVTERSTYARFKQLLYLALHNGYHIRKAFCHFSPI